MTFALSTFHNRVVRIALALFVFAALAVYALPTDHASAGTNGQKIHVHSNNSSVMLTRVRLAGNNQAGSYTTYDSGSFTNKPSHQVNSHWWKGYVQVTLNLAVTSYPGYSTSITCNVYVPPIQSGDVVNVIVEGPTTCH
jgi:beta-lactamase class A